MLAAHDTTIRGIVAMSTVGIAWFEYELANVRRQLVLQGVSPDSVDRAMRVKERCTHDLSALCAYPAHYTYMQQVNAQNIAAFRYLVDAINMMHPGQATLVGGGVPGRRPMARWYQLKVLTSRLCSRPSTRRR